MGQMVIVVECIRELKRTQCTDHVIVPTLAVAYHGVTKEASTSMSCGRDWAHLVSRMDQSIDDPSASCR